MRGINREERKGLIEKREIYREDREGLIEKRERDLREERD